MGRSRLDRGQVDSAAGAHFYPEFDSLRRAIPERTRMGKRGWSEFYPEDLGADVETASSKAYSANVRRMVLVDAMANNLENPPFPFETEIKTHFRLKAKAIRAQIERWRADDDGKTTSRDSFSMGGGPSSSSAESGSQSAFNAAADRLLKLLEGLDSVPAAVKDKKKATQAEVEIEAEAEGEAGASVKKTEAAGTSKKKTASKAKKTAKTKGTTSRNKTKK